jgi:hypothetical protein
MQVTVPAEAATRDIEPAREPVMPVQATCELRDAARCGRLPTRLQLNDLAFYEVPGIAKLTSPRSASVSAW